MTTENSNMKAKIPRKILWIAGIIITGMSIIAAGGLFYLDSQKTNLNTYTIIGQGERIAEAESDKANGTPGGDHKTPPVDDGRADDIYWITNYYYAIELAKSTGKPIFLEFRCVP